MVLSITHSPIIYAGIDENICSTNTLLLNNASAQYESGLVWTTSGSGLFDNPNILNPTYTASSTDISNGSVYLILTASAISPCLEDVSDTLQLYFDASPIAYAGPNDSVCETDSYYLVQASGYLYNTVLWTSSGDGFFDDPTLLNPVYTPGALDITNGYTLLTMTLEAGINCPSTVSMMTLYINHLPIVSAGPDLLVCALPSYSITTATAQNYNTLQWITSGTGSFDDPGIINPVYSPSANDLLNGFVNLSLTADASWPCSGNNSDSFTLSFSLLSL